jgi:hypothetical protein
VPCCHTALPFSQSSETVSLPPAAPRPLTHPSSLSPPLPLPAFYFPCCDSPSLLHSRSVLRPSTSIRSATRSSSAGPAAAASATRSRPSTRTTRCESGWRKEGLPSPISLTHTHTLSLSLIHTPSLSFMRSLSVQPLQVRVLLLSLQTQAAGLTLVRASHVILLEPALDPAIEQQAVARVHRIGQTRETVVTRLLVDGTVEMEVVKVRGRRKGKEKGAGRREGLSTLGRCRHSPSLLMLSCCCCPLAATSAQAATLPRALPPSPPPPSPQPGPAFGGQRSRCASSGAPGRLRGRRRGRRRPRSGALPDVLRGGGGGGGGRRGGERGEEEDMVLDALASRAMAPRQERVDDSDAHDLLAALL